MAKKGKYRNITVARGPQRGAQYRIMEESQEEPEERVSLTIPGSAISAICFAAVLANTWRMGRWSATQTYCAIAYIVFTGVFEIFKANWRDKNGRD